MSARTHAQVYSPIEPHLCESVCSRIPNRVHLITNACIASDTGAALNRGTERGCYCVVLRARERFIGAHPQ